ncbi:nicotinate-nucleotide pyrophosphorylase [Candidatus Termititenax persephonae]|uniref:Probable nicotinate-nucleotide pyrophosphorylase [carboxylating] n=1 Tax=Candidatus Termititenax persephonae TaxID=2218525 RepID=A0A388THR3_9BACT|nr:nicotinate-nucleotide pyrophosphorylase [Candidatus Termititenax persephonae]
MREDAPRGDITSRYFGGRWQMAKGKIIAKANGVLCGLAVARYCFRKSSFCTDYADGDQIKKGTVIAEIGGRLNDLLLAERVALNFLQHLSGVATETNKLVKLLKGTKVKLLDTRKTIPGLRELEKYAVCCGGGQNHRLDLSDMVLVKDNHLAGLRSGALLKRIKRFRFWRSAKKIELEAATLRQVEDFLTLPVNIILLDNMPLAKIKKAVALRAKLNPQIKLEISGGVSEKNIRTLAGSGVDYISCGRITHSAAALDITLLLDAQ